MSLRTWGISSPRAMLPRLGQHLVAGGGGTTFQAGDYLALDGTTDPQTLDVQASSMTWADLGISQSDVSASDVGLGNVENIALSNAGWADLGISKSDVLSFDPIDPTGDNKDLALGSNKLTFGDGQLQSGSGAYLEVLAPDGTNSGELRVDTLNVTTLNVQNLEKHLDRDECRRWRSGRWATSQSEFERRLPDVGRGHRPVRSAHRLLRDL